MPHFIVKADPNEDWYVEWTTITDGPYAIGTRADFLEERPDWEDRLDRADKYGTSALVGGAEPWFGWEDKEFMVAEPLGEQRDLPRKHLKEYSEFIIDDNISAAFALTTPLERD